MHEIQTPQRFSQGGKPARQPGDFDMMETFRALRHLRVKPGETLDYVYNYDGMGGRPMVYARQAGAAPFETLEDYWKSMPTPGPRQPNSGVMPEDEYLQHVVTDDTDAGYFEYAALSLMGDQFYLWWHALYNDITILCSPEDIDQVAVEIKEFINQTELSVDVIEAARQLNLVPTVSLDQDTAVVRFVTFTKWGGFYEYYATYSRTNPPVLLNSGRNLLIEWNCGIMF